jgi:hypothetical protein
VRRSPTKGEKDITREAESPDEAERKWYAAHLILYVQFKNRRQDHFPVWENIVRIQAASVDEAFEKAERRGKEEEGDSHGTFCWGGRPARWVFAGVRQLVLCVNSEGRPGDGTEISYTELLVDSERGLRKLAAGRPVSVRYADQLCD